MSMFWSKFKGYVPLCRMEKRWNNLYAKRCSDCRYCKMETNGEEGDINYFCYQSMMAEKNFVPIDNPWDRVACGLFKSAGWLATLRRIKIWDDYCDETDNK